MYNHNKAQQCKNRVHISWDILYNRDIKFVIIASADVILPNGEMFSCSSARIHWIPVTTCRLFWLSESIRNGRRDITKSRGTSIVINHTRAAVISTATFCSHTNGSLMTSMAPCFAIFHGNIFAVCQYVLNIWGCIWHESYIMYHVACIVLLHMPPGLLHLNI